MGKPIQYHSGRGTLLKKNRFKESIHLMHSWKILSFNQYHRLTERFYDGGYGSVAAVVENRNVRFQFYSGKSELVELRILEKFMKRTR